MTKICKRHVDNPVMIYHQCVGCELEWFHEELEQKQQEIERLREELNAYKPSAEVFYERLQRLVGDRDKLIKLLDMIKNDADRFGELVGIDVSETSLEEKGKAFNRKIEKLQEERNKLIEVLRWYADEKNYRREFHSRHGTLVEPADAIYYDCGQRARDILKEIGAMNFNQEGLM